jgi:PAS domain S-box-containing protein
MRRALEDSASAVRAATAGRESFGEFADYRGVRVLASARSIPLTGWGLVRKIDRAEALEDFHRTARLEVLLAVLFLLALGVPLAMRWRVVVARVLKEEERIFRGLLESFPDAALISSPEGRILLANTWAEKMLGYTLEELVGQPFALVIPERDREGISRQYVLNNPASGQLNQRTEIVYRRKDGTEFPAEVSLSLIATSAGVVVCSSLRDITERKQAEVALVQERHLLRTLMDNLPDVIYFKDRESRFTRINQALAKGFGLSDPAQAIGKRDFDFFTGEHAQQAFADEQEIIRTGQPMLGKEEKETWPDGHVTWVSSTKMPLRDARGNIVGTFGVSRDVTPRKRAEEELRHLNRALTAISAVNQAILHTSEEPSLLQEVCRCIVDHAGYRMAWVGFLSDSEPRTISPVAQAGMEQGSLDSINVTYDDSERGRGPTGTAARTRRPAIVRNTATAEDYAPWRAEASAWGYASVIGLPLLFAENLLGVLTIYSAQPQAFDQQEVDFLSELAADLAYGIQALRTRAEQARAEAALLEERHLLHTLMDNLPDVIYFKDRESRFTRINQALAKSFGLGDPAQAVGKRDFDFFTGEHAEQAFADEQEIVRTGQPVLGKEEKETWPDGHVTWVSSTKMPLRDARGNIVGTFGVSRDITERKRAQETLQVSERQLAEAMDRALLAHWELNTATRMFTFNDRFYALYGTTAEREGGYQMSAETYAREFLFPEDMHIVAEEIAKGLATTDPDAAGTVEHRIRRRDGEIRHIVVRISAIKNSEGLTIKTRGVNQDITERKRAEEELRHLNRALTAISAVNQAILHTSEEPSLLQEVCRCVVDHAGYRVAWVGFLSDSEPRTISPVAQAGMEQGSLDSINVTYDDSERGRGPTGTAARTRRPAIVRNTATAEDYAPWRAEASAWGYASVIGLPLLFAENLLGVLTIYSAQPQAFDQQEVDFLSELAADLAYGIQALRTRAEQARAEAALLEERRLLHTLINNLPDYIYYKDRQSRFLLTNAAHAKTLGLGDPSQAIGKTDFDFFPAQDAGNYFKDEQQVVESGQPLIGREERFQQPDGQLGWCSTTKVPIRDAQGRVTGLVGISRDVTERRRSEEELRHVNRALTAISAVNQAILHATEEPGLLQEVCRCVVEQAGYRMAWVGFLHDGEPRTVSPMAQAGMEQGDLESIKVTYDESEWGRGPTGTAARTRRPAIVRNVATAEDYAPWRAEASAQGYASVIGLPLLFAGNLLGVLTVYSVETEAFDQQEVDFLSELAGDLAYGIQALRTRAEQARAEAALLEERHLLHTLMDNLPDVIYFKDRESRFTRINQALAKSFGLGDPVQAVGKRDFDFFTGEHAQQAFADEQEIVRTGQPMLAKEEKETWPDGHVTWASSTKMPLRDARGNIVGTFGVSRDITPHKVLEEQLRLSQRMESVGRLAGGVAHDFNNLLTIIAGYTQLVKGGLDEGSALHGHVDEVLKASDRAASLTQQLLAFSRKQVLQVEVLDLNTALGNLEKMLLRLIGEDIELKTVPQAGLGRVKADPGQIDQVIMNLVVNARDAMPQGGTITIETANMDLTEDYTRSHFPVVPGRYVMVSVSDTGTGMSQEIQAHIFEPFFTTKEKGKGTGLGLATVYGIVKQSGGYIWVYSELGRGSTFKVYLPRVEGPLAEAESAKVSLDSVKGSETVLVVEDEEAVRSLVRKTLESHGYKVLESQGADDALSILEQYAEPIHLLLTDVVMPQMSGQELAKRLLAMRPEVKVIYMSGYTDDAIVRHGVLEAGVSFVQKPFAPTTLAQKVRDVLKS